MLTFQIINKSLFKQTFLVAKFYIEQDPDPRQNCLDPKH
jgi:hypothetical protein